MVGSTAPIPSSDGVPTSPPNTEPGRLPAPRRWSALLWPILCLFQLGIVASWGWQTFVSQPDLENANDSNHQQKNSTEKQKEPSQPASVVKPAGTIKPPQVTKLPITSSRLISDLAQADQLFLEGRHELALAILKPLRTQASGYLRDSLLFRMALCLEGMGKWDRAVEANRQLASSGIDPKSVLTGRLGQARIYLKLNRPKQAKTLLSNLLLLAALPALQGQPILAEARYLFALSLAQEADAPSRPGPFNQVLASHPGADWPVERYLDWVESPKTKAGMNLEPAKNDLRVMPVGNGIPEPIVSCSGQLFAVRLLLERVTKKLNLELEWTNQARAVLESRTSSLAVENFPWQNLFHLMLVPRNLGWRLRGKKLTVMSIQEFSTAERAHFQRATAQRFLRESILTQPGHYLVADAYLALGNLSAASGQLNDALGWYARLIREQSRSRLNLEAHYDLGVVQYRLNDRDGARTSFYKTADLAPGHKLASLAFLWVGRLHLEDADPTKALTPLRRALTSSVGSATEPAAALLSAAALLLANNAPAAQHILRKHHKLLMQPSYRSSLIFLTAMARYQGLGTEQHAKRESGNLLASLLDVGGAELLQPVGPLLLGQAFRAIGLDDQMIKLYQQAIPKSPRPLAEKMKWAVAESFFAAEQTAAARKLFLELGKSNSPTVAFHGQLRLAEIALLSNHLDESLTRCQKLLRDYPKHKKAEILKIMGNAFAQRGDHQKAVQCFSGRIPGQMDLPKH